MNLRKGRGMGIINILPDGKYLGIYSPAVDAGLKVTSASSGLLHSTISRERQDAKRCDPKST